MPDWKEIKEALLVVYHRWLTRAPPYGKCGCSSVIHVSFCTPPWKKITVNYSTMSMPHHRDVLNICNRNSKPSVRKQLQLIKKLRKKENEDKANLQSIYAIDHDIGTRGFFLLFLLRLSLGVTRWVIWRATGRRILSLLLHAHFPTLSNVLLHILQPFSFFRIDDYTANTLFTDIMMKNTDIIPKK